MKMAFFIVLVPFAGNLCVLYVFYDESKFSITYLRRLNFTYDKCNRYLLGFYPQIS